MGAQGRLGDKASIQSDAHGCPGCPHAGMGPGVIGSPNVNVNSRPALRKGDSGVHAACCGPNMWTADGGSSTVFINGKAAYRVDDAAKHCGGSGKLAEGSPDVNVGDAGGSGAGQDASGDSATLLITEVRGLYMPSFDDGTGKRCGYRLGYKSEDDLGRVFINAIPRTGTDWSTVWRKDKQYIELIAEVVVSSSSGSSQPPSNLQVEWEWSDPDDPSNGGLRPDASATLDANDQTGPTPVDNQGECDHPNAGSGSGARFQAMAGYSMTPGATQRQCSTAVQNDRSEVRLHLTNVGGDNFIVRARVRPQGTLRTNDWDTTGRMTMWKRIDVEYVKIQNAAELPVDRVPPCFEPAFIQLDFVPRQWSGRGSGANSDWSGEFLADTYEDAVSARRRLVEDSAAFTNMNRPGWFLLVAARGHARNQNVGTSPVIFDGRAYVNGETLTLDPLNGVHHNPGIDAVRARFFENGHTVDFGVAGQGTQLTIHPKTYASWFVPPHDLDGSITFWDPATRQQADGRGDDVVDDYYPMSVRHYGSRGTTPPGNGFELGRGAAGSSGAPVDVRVFGPGAREVGGDSPPLRHSNGKYYFVGRTIVFDSTLNLRASARLEVRGTFSPGDRIDVNIDGNWVSHQVGFRADVRSVLIGLADAIARSALRDRVRVRCDLEQSMLIEWHQSGTAGNGKPVHAATFAPSSGTATFDRNQLDGGGLDVNKAVKFITHELTHGFGMPHVCGYPTAGSTSQTCVMNVGYSVWLYDAGTSQLRRFDYGSDSASHCPKHTLALRHVHLEDNLKLGWR